MITTTLATSQNWPKKTTILLLNCFQTTLQNNTIGVQDAQGTTVCTMYLEVKVQYSLECLRSVHIKNTHTHTHTLSLSLSHVEGLLTHVTMDWIFSWGVFSFRHNNIMLKEQVMLLHQFHEWWKVFFWEGFAFWN
jgi:hypothetical protein